jgi:putative colanic acid biosynthesis glycosyltransferase
MDKIISIITVTKNDITRLKKTINSLNRFYNDSRYEIIIIDGGSIDGSIEYLETLENIKNLNINSSRDKGIYDAMNTGIYLSHGKFLNFLNCGDCISMSPNSLIQSIERYLKEDKVDIVCFCFEEEFRTVIKRRTIRTIKAHKLPCSHQAMLFSTNFIRDNLYNLKYKIAADYDLYSRAKHSRVSIDINSDILVRVEGNGYASSNPIRAYREYIDIASHNYKGFIRLKILISIFLRAVFVIVMKLFVPKFVYFYFKNKLG